MGRLVAQIPNEDPARLARVQDAKWRTIGVSCALAAFLSTARWITAQNLLKLLFPRAQVDRGALERQLGERQAKQAFDAQRDR